MLTFLLTLWRMKIPRKAPFARRKLAVASRMAAGLAPLFLLAAAAQAQQPAVEGAPVAEIRVVDESGKPVAARTPPLALQPGKPFDYADERASLRALYQTGDYSEIRVNTAPDARGLRVDFVAVRNYYYNSVRVAGLKPPPSEPAAVAALRLGLGEAFRESSLDEGIERLKEALEQEGFYEAKVTCSLARREDTRQMDVAVHVEPGLRARIGSIEVQNQSPYSDAELIRRSKLKAAQELTALRVSRASQRLRKSLVEQGYLRAAAVIHPGTYDPQTKQAPVTYMVVAGPHVRVEVHGGRLSASRVRKLLPVYAEGAVDEDLLQEGRRNIRDFLQREGYFNADVQVSSREEGGERLITYEISAGPPFRLAGISFDGNKYFSKELLAKRLQLQTASFASSGRFSQRMVHDDAESIRGLYISNGFRDAQATSTVDDKRGGKKGNLFVAFHIVEGPQTLVSQLEVEGNHALSEAALRAVAGSSPGQPYSDAGVASDRNNILALYYNAGFPQARFREEVLPAGEANRVRLVYHLAEGEKIEVAQVLLSGYQYTHTGIIARQVQIRAAGPLREGDVVETQHRLYNLGIFNRVQIAPQNPNGTDPDKTVVVNVQEGGRYTVGYGGGFEVQRIAGGSQNPNGTIIGASPRGIFEIGRTNMFGRAQTLTFRVRASTLQYRALASYTADNFLANRKLDLLFIAFADKSQDINTFTSIRYEGSLQLVEKLSPASSILYQYFYRRVEIPPDSLKINPEQVPLLSQPTLVSGVRVTYARDRRDNPGDAKRGTFNTGDAGIASRTLGSSASFFRGFFQNSSFAPFGRAFVFARSVRFGVEVPLDGTNETEVPLPERFFAGGGTSIRGFGLNQAGPRDPVTGFPIGGLALLAFNQELRFPMKLPYIGNRLGGTLFYDAGNVYKDINHISFAWKPPSVANLDYFSHTVGFGVRYPTPIGPVRVDLGYQLNPPRYQGTTSEPPILQFPEIFRIPHFQFFFNIGPVF